MVTHPGKITVLLALILFYGTLAFAQVIHQNIDQNWQFRQVGKQDWLSANVPGTVHTDLLTNHKIADPYYGTNKKDQQWIEKEDWEYKTTFDVSPDVFAMDQISIVFHGLDTYADIYLNNVLIQQANNMFRTLQLPVDHYLREGSNQLRIVFHSISKMDSVNNSQSADTSYRDFARKAAYQFGRDGDPRLVTFGIWRPVELVAWKNARFSDVFAQQMKVDDDRAHFMLHADIEASRPFFSDLNVYIDGKMVRKDKVGLRFGNNENEIRFDIAQPELWWPNGYGKQKLYELKIDLVKDGEIISSCSRKIGVRTIELMQKSDKEGAGFYLKVNGVPIFMKGPTTFLKIIFCPASLLSGMKTSCNRPLMPT